MVPSVAHTAITAVIHSLQRKYAIVKAQARRDGSVSCRVRLDERSVRHLAFIQGFFQADHNAVERHNLVAAVNRAGR